MTVSMTDCGNGLDGSLFMDRCNAHIPNRSICRLHFFLLRLYLSRCTLFQNLNLLGRSSGSLLAKVSLIGIQIQQTSDLPPDLISALAANTQLFLSRTLMMFSRQGCV